MSTAHAKIRRERTAKGMPRIEILLMSLTTAQKANVKTQPETSESRLVAAAMRCIEKYGIKKTFMEDIAKEAGLSRQTAYRVFTTRRELLQRLADQRFLAMEEALRPRVSRYRSFEEALVKGIALSMQVAREDKVFVAILETLGDEGLERYMLGSDSPVIATMTGVWSGVIERAIAKNELRSGLTLSDVITWLIAVECILLLKDDLSAAEQERFLRKLMVPAMLAPAVSAT